MGEGREKSEATKQRRLAIKEYWRTKSEDLRRNPRDFFKTFKPFLSDKGIRSDPDIELNIGGDIVGFHMTSLKFKLKNYRSYRDFTFTVY